MENLFEKIDEVLTILIQNLLSNCMNNSQEEREREILYLTSYYIKQNRNLNLMHQERGASRTIVQNTPDRSR